MYDNQETFVEQSKRVGRNDPCPCGSGKKSKRCCRNKADPVDPESPSGHSLGSLYGMDELPQEQWLWVVMNDHGFTSHDYVHRAAFRQTGELDGDEYSRACGSLSSLSFSELMEQCGIPRMDEEDVRWLISKGWRDASVKDYMTAECFRYVRMLIEDRFVSFRDEKAMILESMYDYPSVHEWRESRAVESPG